MSAPASKAKVHVSLSPSLLFLSAAITVETLLVLTLLHSCQTTFDCRTFWPTVSYMAAYRGHDRMVCFALTLSAMVLPVFFLCAYARYRAVLSPFTSSLMLLLGVLISALVPAVGVIDEANSSNVAPLELIHYWLVVGLISLGGLWTVCCVVAMERLQKRGGDATWTYLSATGVMLLVTTAEWVFAGSVYANAWVNESVQAVCEWTTVSLVLFAPYTLSLSFPALEVSFVGR